MYGCTINFNSKFFEYWYTAAYFILISPFHFYGKEVILSFFFNVIISPSLWNIQGLLIFNISIWETVISKKSCIAYLARKLFTRFSKVSRALECIVILRIRLLLLIRKTKRRRKYIALDMIVWVKLSIV